MILRNSGCATLARLTLNQHTSVRANYSSFYGRVQIGRRMTSSCSETSLIIRYDTKKQMALYYLRMSRPPSRTRIIFYSISNFITQPGTIRLPIHWSTGRYYMGVQEQLGRASTVQLMHFKLQQERPYLLKCCHVACELIWCAGRCESTGRRTCILLKLNSVQG